MDLVTEVLQWVLTIIGAASAIVAALRPIAAKTETKTDDAILDKIDSVVQYLVAIGDKVAMNPKSDK